MKPLRKVFTTSGTASGDGSVRADALNTAKRKEYSPDFPQNSASPGNPFRIWNKLKSLLNFTVSTCILLGFCAVRLWHRISAITRRGFAKVQRVLGYLADQQNREPLAYYADDLGLAWNVLLAAWRGQEHPYEYAFVRKFGKSPEKLIPLWQQRNAEQIAFADRPPKKEPQSVPVEQAQTKKAGAL